MNRTSSLNFAHSLDPNEITKVQEAINCDLEQQLSLSKQIGSYGENGRIYDAILADIPVVIKVVDDRQKARNEILINEHLRDSDSFLKFYGSTQCRIQNRFSTLLVLERAIGDLEQVLTQNTVSRLFLREVVDTVADIILEMFERGVNHRDLHCRNIFLVDHHQIVVGDFGESTLTTSFEDFGNNFTKFLFDYIRVLSNISRPSILEGLEKLKKFNGKFFKNLEKLYDELTENGTSDHDASQICNQEYHSTIKEYWASIN